MGAPKGGKPPKSAWKPGQSGNPKGGSKKRRELRASVKEQLDKAFTDGDSDLLVDAIVRGVQKGDSTITRLACEYRWGRPVTQVELTGEGGGPVELAGVAELFTSRMARLVRGANKKKQDSKGDERA